MAVKRKPTDRAQLPIRVRESLRARLEKSAKARGVSLNAEIVRRLEQSVGKEDELGGPELVHLVNLMASAFLQAGNAAARFEGHPEWTVAEWSADPICYIKAVKSVAQALAGAHPEFQGDEVFMEVGKKRKSQ